MNIKHLLRKLARNTTVIGQGPALSDIPVKEELIVTSSSPSITSAEEVIPLTLPVYPIPADMAPPDAGAGTENSTQVPQEAPLLEDAKPLMDRAAVALAAGDMEAAQVQWRLARSASNAPVDAWIMAAEHGGDVAAGVPASVLLQEALQHFPQDRKLLYHLARASEQRKDWPAAETYWRVYIENEGRQWWAYAAWASALLAQDRDADAYLALRDGVSRLPNEPQMLAEIARAALSRDDLPQAMEAWEVVIARFPSVWIGYRGKVQTLSRLGRFEEAEQLIDTEASLLQNDVDALHDLARFAERRREWKRAESAWRSFLRLDQRHAWAYCSLAGALRQQSHHAEADIILRDARQKFPKDVELIKESARCAESGGDLTEAGRLWEGVTTLQPESPEGPLGQAATLRRQGETEAADEVVLAAIKRLPDEPALLEAYGVNAIARHDLDEALIRLETGQRRFPSHDALRQRLFEVRLKIADAGGSASSTPLEDGTNTDDRDLVMHFESLGGGGHGCEFGIFQRQFGAEPLGLLRWADIYQDQLSQVLETEFAGVGDPEFTNIFVPNGMANPEYWTSDTRYHMAMRSFVAVADVPLDRMRQQVTRRFTYLSRKLADDLRAGTKIFVYKNMKRNLTNAELDRLHAACRRYGDNTLLYIRYEDADHPSGTVVAEGDGLLVGYIDHFSHAADTDEFLGSASDAFLRICKNAYALWQRDDSGGDAGGPPLIEKRLADAEDAARIGSIEVVQSLIPGLIADLDGQLQTLMPIALALISQAEFDEADNILRVITTAMPNYFPAFETYGMSAFHRRDWAATISRWRLVQQAFPDRPSPALWLAGALLATRQFDEAEETLRTASERFPDDLEIARDYARLPLARGDVEEALSRTAALRERFPFSVDGFAIGAEALRTLGRFEEAESLLESVRSQFGHEFHYNFQSARNATSLGRWGVAFVRWNILLAQSPNDQGVDAALGDAITLWHLAKIEGDRAAIDAELPNEIASRVGTLLPREFLLEPALASDRELFMSFEGLGDRCEFGLAQRHFGAEPIGLLRWSGIEPKHLIAALECRFEGVGESENTFVQLNENSDEYFAGDNRFFYVHTFIKKNEENEAGLFEKMCKRLTYLKRKLLTDLEEGEKIFVYKAHVGELTNAEADGISSVLARHYPASRVVLLRLARDAAQVGTVEPLGGNAVWAFLSAFSQDLDSRFIRFDEWREALRAARQYFIRNSLENVAADLVMIRAGSA